jgi:hypothetical protein
VDLSNAKEQEFMFQHRVAQQVTNEVAAALTEYPNLFGKFEVTDVEEGEPLDFASLETTEANLETPQTGVDSPAPKKSARASTSSAS